LEGDRLKAAADGLLEVASFQQGHAERVPTIEKRGIDRDAASVERDGFVKLANGEVAVGLVEEVLKVV
jgi:hypothetical protein